MSFLFLLFYWIALPLIIIFAVVALLRLNIGLVVKGIIVILGLGAAAWLLWVAVGETWMLDRQVRELCAKDGGIKVYETVPLLPELVDKYGVIRIPTKTKATSNDQYYYVSKLEYLRKKNPVIWKRTYRYYRYIDNMLLGESISFARRGGGLPGPWHESSFGCNNIKKNQPQLVTSVFIKEKLK